MSDQESAESQRRGVRIWIDLVLERLEAARDKLDRGESDAARADIETVVRQVRELPAEVERWWRRDPEGE